MIHAKNDKIKHFYPLISVLEPHDVKSSTRFLKAVADGTDTLQYKSRLLPKVKCFQESYFVRSVKYWNDLPFEFDLRNTGDQDSFQVKC